MSKTIEEIKEEYAKGKGRVNWSDLIGYTTANSLTKVSTAVSIDNNLTEVAQRYAQYQTQELQEQNAELVNLFKRLIDNRMMSVIADIEAKELLTKHNHLKKM